MAQYKNPIIKGKLKSTLKTRYDLAFVTEKGTTVYDASDEYMKVLDKSGNIFLKNYDYKWEGDAVIIEGGEEGPCIITSTPSKFKNS